MAGVDVYKLSIVFMSPKWQNDGYGIATINRSLINDLYGTDPEGQRLRLACMTAEQDSNITEKDRDDAEKYNVTLVGAKLPKGVRRKEVVPDLEWLNIHPFHWHITEIENIDVVIGHVPYIADGPENVKELCRNQQHNIPQVGLIIHSLPQDDDGDIDDKLLTEWLKGADFVFSVGKGIQMEIEGYLSCFEETSKVKHELYLPGCDVELLKIDTKLRQEPAKGPQMVTMITGEKKQLNIKGLDFKLAVGATAKATSKILEQSSLRDQVSVNFTSVGALASEKESWKENFNEIMEDVSRNDKRLKFTHKTMHDEEEFRNILKRSDLCILPLYKDSKLFGAEALMAAYAGVPLLVSKNAGIADLLYPIPAEDSMIETKGVFTEDAQNWMLKITKRILNAKDSGEEAKAIKQHLVKETSIELSHQKFVSTLLGTFCARLQCTLEGDQQVMDSVKHLASNLGIDLDDDDKTNIAEMYIHGFTRFFHIQGKKIKLGLLDEKLLSHPGVKQVWDQLISLLERRGRKVLEIHRGSLIFMVFCPTQNALEDLKELAITGAISQALNDFLITLGLHGTVTRSVVRWKYDFPSTIPAPSSDIGSGESGIYDTETILSEEKTMDWLAQNHDLMSVGNEKDRNIAIARLKKNVNLPLLMQDDYVKRFTFSPSNEIVYSHSRQEHGSFTSQIHIRSNERLLASQKGTAFLWDVAYIHRQSTDQLVTSQGEKLFLWDSKLQGSKMVYQKKIPHGPVWEATLCFCLVTKDSLACVHRLPRRGYHMIEILDTWSDKWFPIETIQVKLGWASVSDMCYTSYSDNPHFIMCSYKNERVASVGLKDGEVRWHISGKDVGVELKAHSICADHNGMVFVSCGNDHSIYMLSAEDGTLISHINSEPPICFPNCVRIHQNKLWVSHVELQAWRKGVWKWQISQYELENLPGKQLGYKVK